MGRSWRSKSADRSDERRSDSGEFIYRGSLQTQKQQIYSKLASDSKSSYLESGNSYRYLATAGDSQPQSTYSTRSSIKQLLAEEMSNGGEQKRRSPSIIARLMGFEGLSPQQTTHKQSPNHPAHSQHTYSESRKPLKQQKHFKDVFEVSMPLKDEKRGYQSRRIATSELSKEDVTFVRQKFLDAKRFATDEKFQGTKEFNDALEVLDSNKDLFLQLLQEPDSMFMKHLHDLRRTYPRSQYINKVSQEPSGIQRYGTNDVETKLWKESSKTNSANSRKKSKDSFHSTNIHDLGNPNWSKETDGRSVFPTKIVVLKPNFRRMQVSEPESKIHSCESISEFESKKSQNVRIRNFKQVGKTQPSDDFQRPRHNAGESRELAKRITQKMRGSLRTGSLDFLLDGLQEYGADISSCYESGNDSSNGSEIVSSRKSVASANRKSGMPKSHFSGSPVNSETKKRLSERWKMTQRFQEVGLRKSNTLGEMLSVPDSGKDSEIVILAGKGSIKDGRLNREEKQVGPLGISSRDGWRYDHTMRLSRSASPSPSFGTHESTVRRKLSNDDRHLMINMSYKDPNKAMEEITFYGLGSKDRSRRSRSERSHSSNNTGVNHSAENLELTASHISITPSCDDLPHEKDIMVLEMSACSNNNANLVIDEVQDAQHETLAMSSASMERFHHGESTCLSNIQLPICDMGTSNMKKNLDEKSEGYTVPLNCLAVGPVSPGRSTEAEQPSPMSVLAVPFPDDLTSGTDCFGSLTADLQGLRMQLQLLKQESAGYAEEYMAISSSEDDDECAEFSEKKSLAVMDSLDCSYIVDALAISGFYDVDPYTYMATWHSLDCPMGPSEFEKLEEKYGEQAIWSWAEKKILFDLINTGLVEIFRQFLDSNPWVKQSQLRTVLDKDKDSLEGKLLKWLETQISQESGGNASEQAFGKELEWNLSSCHIDQVGSEMERLLTDELIAEMLEMW